MSKHIYSWAVIGAGPAGIAAVGKLLDKGFSKDEILWIDPAFMVGDLGRLWCNVSSNTKVKLFLRFLNECDSFAYQQAPIDFTINHLPQDSTCLLRDVVEPLLWVTKRLLDAVHSAHTFIHRLTLANRLWTLEGSNAVYYAKNVISAVGALPRSLDYPMVKAIAFEDAINKERLQLQINQNETVAVFGSSHSAIIIIRYLVELGIKKIINFYRTPCCYAVDMGDWILFDNTGLKGDAAIWAREHIDGVMPKNLTRYSSIEPHLERYLHTCDKAIYAVGFKPRQDLLIGAYDHMGYNPHVGIIAPGLFGLGIAYPEKKADPFGSYEMQVGLWKFMTYLNKVLPIWLKYHA